MTGETHAPVSEVAGERQRRSLYSLGLMVTSLVNASAVWLQRSGGVTEPYVTYLAPAFSIFALLLVAWLLLGQSIRMAERAGVAFLSVLAVAQEVLGSLMAQPASYFPSSGPYWAMLTAAGVAFLCLPKRLATALTIGLGSLCLALPWVLGGEAARTQPATLLRLQLSAAGVGLVIWALAWFRTQHAVQVATERLLRDLAFTDAVTGLPNRRSIYGQLDTFLERANGPLAGGLLLLDIDHFKQVNDRFGHLGGDAVLAAVGELLNGLVGANPGGGRRVGRWGGEEFIVLLPGQLSSEVAAEAERIRLAFREKDWPVDSGITVSIGAALVAHGDDSASLVARADQALYHAKQAGRDQVVVAAVGD